MLYGGEAQASPCSPSVALFYPKNVMDSLVRVVPLSRHVALSVFPGPAISLQAGTGMLQKSGGLPMSMSVVGEGAMQQLHE